MKLEDKVNYYTEEGKQQLKDYIDKLSFERHQFLQRSNNEQVKTCGTREFSIETSTIDRIQKDRLYIHRIKKLSDDFDSYHVIEKHNDDSVVDIDDFIEVKVIFSDMTIDRYIMHLTGLYISDIDSEIPDVSINTPIGRAVYGKEIGVKVDTNLPNSRVTVEVLAKGKTLEELTTQTEKEENKQK